MRIHVVIIIATNLDLSAHINMHTCMHVSIKEKTAAGLPICRWLCMSHHHPSLTSVYRKLMSQRSCWYVITTSSHLVDVMEHVVRWTPSCSDYTPCPQSPSRDQWYRRSQLHRTLPPPYEWSLLLLRLGLIYLRYVHDSCCSWWWQWWWWSWW